MTNITQDQPLKATPAAPVRARGAFKRVLSVLDMTLFTVCAILVIDQLPASAAIGAQAIFWWVVTFVLFFIPYGLITSELGSAYPRQGGIYVWVKRAFGPRWGTRTAWLWWVNVALWMPSVYILFAGMFAQLFFPDLNLWAQIALCLALTWGTVGLNIVALDVGKWVPNVGAIVKALIMLVVGVGGIAYGINNGFANDLSLSAMMPEFGASLAFLPVVVYNFMGFELMSGASEEMQNPARDVPKAIVIAGLVISGFYLLGTVGILSAIPVEQIGLVEGLIDTLQKVFGTTGFGGMLVMLIGIGALFSFIANMVTWTISANRSASEAALAGDMPESFAKQHEIYKTPVNAALWTGVVASVVVIIYGFMAGTGEELFWQLFAFSSIVFLLPYLAMFPAFLRLRQIDPTTPRPYRVPGSTPVLIVLVALCMIFIAQAVVFFVVVPGEAVDWLKVVPMVAGVVITLLIGEAIAWRGYEAGKK
jgi:amino acid transporter